MTPEQKAEFVKIFSGPQRRGRDLFGGRRYDLVRFEDGTVGFVRNTLDAEIERALANALNEVYGPDSEPEKMPKLIAALHSSTA